MPLHKGSLPNIQSFVTTFLYVFLVVLLLSFEFNIGNTGMECCLGPWARVCLLGAGFNSTDYLLHWKQQTSRSLVYFPETVSSKFNIPLWSISPLEGPFRYKRVNIKYKEPKVQKYKWLFRWTANLIFWQLEHGGCLLLVALCQNCLSTDV